MNANLLPGVRAVPRTRQPHDDEAGDWRGLDAPVQRDRYEAIRSVIGSHVARGARVLDVGCGEAMLAPFLPGFTYEGVEPSALAAARASERAAYRIHHQSAEEFAPAAGTKFDAIVFNEMLYYSPDPIAVLRKFRSFLSEHGAFIISIYLKPEPRRPIRHLLTRWFARRRVSNVECARRVRRFLAEGWRVLDHRTIPIAGTVPPQYWELWLASPDDRRAFHP